MKWGLYDLGLYLLCCGKAPGQEPEDKMNCHIHDEYRMNCWYCGRDFCRTCEPLHGTSCDSKAWQELKCG